MQKNLNIKKITFKFVQMKSLAMHITNQKLSFKIFTLGNLLNIFMEHDLNILMIFWHKRKMDNFDPYNVLWAIATNIPVLYVCMFDICLISKCLTFFNHIGIETRNR